MNHNTPLTLSHPCLSSNGLAIAAHNLSAPLGAVAQANIGAGALPGAQNPVGLRAVTVQIHRAEPILNHRLGKIPIERFDLGPGNARALVADASRGLGQVGVGRIAQHAGQDVEPKLGGDMPTRPYPVPAAAGLDVDTLSGVSLLDPVAFVDIRVHRTVKLVAQPLLVRRLLQGQVPLHCGIVERDQDVMLVSACPGVRKLLRGLDCPV